METLHVIQSKYISLNKWLLIAAHYRLFGIIYLEVVSEVRLLAFFQIRYLEKLLVIEVQ